MGPIQGHARDRSMKGSLSVGARGPDLQPEFRLVPLVRFAKLRSRVRVWRQTLGFAAGLRVAGSVRSRPQA
ncbi:MAG: hypothetical protein EBW20_08170 [Betaproteobacteria bacterium]|nr:hypothetical protein [Betaproteobacteria bacterium]